MCTCVSEERGHGGCACVHATLSADKYRGSQCCEGKWEASFTSCNTDTDFKVGLGGCTSRVIDLQHARYMGQEIASPLPNSRKSMQHQLQPTELKEALSGQKTEANHQPVAIVHMTDQRLACM
jgi:hypothetical protein